MNKWNEKKQVILLLIFPALTTRQDHNLVKGMLIVLEVIIIIKFNVFALSIYLSIYYNSQKMKAGNFYGHKNLIELLGSS